MRRPLLFLLILIPFLASAQSQRVTGKVVTASEPGGMIGVNVFIKGTSQGTITDINGTFALDVTPGATLVFSFIGHKTKEIIYKGESNIDVTLEEDSKELSEVLVVGYSSIEKRDITGAVGSLKSDKYKDMSVTGLDQALQGQMPGVQVVQSSGTPGGGISVHVRGSTSINASNRPLYIVDGVPVESGGLSQGDYGGQDDNALALLNPNDIESIQVLQDASSKATYGSRAANGVVVIVTKHGKKGPAKISADVQRGIVDPVKKLALLNSTQLLALQREAVQNAGQNPDGLGLIPGVTDAVNTDWQKAIFRTGILQQYQLSASGGDDNTTFYLSGSYRDEEGVQLNNRFQRLSGTFNLDEKFNQKLTVSTNITLSHGINNRVKSDNFLDGVYSGAIKSLPYYTPYDENGRLVGPSSPLYPGFPNFNPVAQAVLPRFTVTTTKIVGNIHGLYKFSEAFQLKSQVGIDYNNIIENQYESSQTAVGGTLANVGGKGLGVFNTSVISNFVANTVLMFNKKIGSHQINALAGSEVIQRPELDASVSGRLFPSDDFTYIASAGIVDNGSSSTVTSGLLSFFGEGRYNYKDKYLATVSFRADGSSRFGAGNRFGYFPALSAGWRISEEKFFHSDVITDLKLRGSYGLTGNERIGDFQFLGTWAAGTYSGSTGLVPNSVGNPRLKWETTQEINIGIDMSALNGRIQVTLDAYNNETYNLLYTQPLSLTTGFASLENNVGRLQNKGIQLGLVSVNVDKAIRWTTEVNLSKNENKVLYLADNTPKYTGYQAEGSSATNIVEVGQPLGTFTALKFLGVDPATGNALYQDTNHDGVIDINDAVVVGNAQPKLIGGVRNVISYKGFDLNIFFQFSYGNDILNFTKTTLLNSGQSLSYNQSVDALRRWQKPGDITDVPKYSLGANNNQNNLLSSRFIEDGSYLRLKNLAVGYNIPANIANKLKFQRLRVFASGTNLWTLTKYSGADPEVSTLDGSTSAQGIDFFTLPQVRTITVGLNANF